MKNTSLKHPLLGAAAALALTGKPLDELRRGAEEARKQTDNVHDPRALERFLSLLELAYLTASADGLADGERDALAHSIETATGGV